MITPTRTLGLGGQQVSAVGLGCWAIGGPFRLDGKADGWGAVDDDESSRAINRAVDLGVTVFDTADVYGTGRSERVLGRALRGRRHEVVVATKFGFTYDESAREITGIDLSPAYVRRACIASLTRLGTDYIDLYQLHVGEADAAAAADVFAVLEDLVDEGKIRAYGWSTDDAERVRGLGPRPHAAAVEFSLNILSDAPAMLTACDDLGLAALVRSPLAMGLLTGKFDADTQLPADDVRGSGHSWVGHFTNGKPDPDALRRLDAIRDILTSGGRTLAQGALAWILARNHRTIPIPGFKTVAQAEDNAGTLDHGPLTPDQMAEIEALLHHENAHHPAR